MEKHIKIFTEDLVFYFFMGFCCCCCCYLAWYKPSNIQERSKSEVLDILISRTLSHNAVGFGGITVELESKLDFFAIENSMIFFAS